MVGDQHDPVGADRADLGVVVAVEDRVERRRGPLAADEHRPVGVGVDVQQDGDDLGERQALPQAGLARPGTDVEIQRAGDRGDEEDGEDGTEQPEPLRPDGVFELLFRDGVPAEGLSHRAVEARQPAGVGAHASTSRSV